MKAIVLAAGYAVRLQPLTLHTSKSLLVIGKRKIIDRIIDKIASLKEDPDIYIISNARFFGDFKEWRRSSAYGDRVSLVNDGTTTNETRLGAIRDLGLAIREESIDDDLLVVAGDNLFDFELAAFLEFARANADGVSVALRDIGDIGMAKNFGVVKIDEHNRVVDFEEKPAEPKSTLISTGIYYFPKEKLPFIKEYVKMRDKLDAPGNYICWLAGTDKVYGFTFLEDWYDIGNIESYKKADAEYLKKERKRNGKA